MPKTAGAKKEQLPIARESSKTGQQQSSKQQHKPATCQPFWPFQHRTSLHLGAAKKSKERSPNHIIGLTLTDPVLETTRDRSVW